MGKINPILFPINGINICKIMFSKDVYMDYVCELKWHHVHLPLMPS